MKCLALIIPYWFFFNLPWRIRIRKFLFKVKVTNLTAYITPINPCSTIFWSKSWFFNKNTHLLGYRLCSLWNCSLIWIIRTQAITSWVSLYLENFVKIIFKNKNLIFYLNWWYCYILASYLYWLLIGIPQRFLNFRYFYLNDFC